MNIFYLSLGYFSFSLMKFNVSISPFMDNAFVISKKSLSNPKSQRFPKSGDEKGEKYTD